MFAPDSTTHELAHMIQRERLSHAALLQKVARERAPDSVTLDRQAQRRITIRRLAASLTAVALALVTAAAAAGAQ